MTISRRQFLELCRNAGTAVGLGALQLAQLEQALASTGAPTVLWLQGAACTGCSVSLLNRIANSVTPLSSGPADAADVLINYINLRYHPTVMAAAGDSAAAIADGYRTAATGGGRKRRPNFVLAVEGGVPTAFGGATCWAWASQGQEVTFLDAVRGLASNASAVLCVGTCSAYGGIPAAPPNPTGIKSVSAATRRATINIPGCPPHPDWIVWAIAALLTNSLGTLDSYGRPVRLFNSTVHNQCPRREKGEATTYGQDGLCTEELGCFGPDTIGPCPITLWNNRQNWCVDANSLCIGCTNPTFPGRYLRRYTYAVDD